MSVRLSPFCLQLGEILSLDTLREHCFLLSKKDEMQQTLTHPNVAIECQGPTIRGIDSQSRLLDCVSVTVLVTETVFMWVGVPLGVGLLVRVSVGEEVAEQEGVREAVTLGVPVEVTVSLRVRCMAFLAVQPRWSVRVKTPETSLQKKPIRSLVLQQGFLS